MSGFTYPSGGDGNAGQTTSRISRGTVEHPRCRSPIPRTSALGGIPLGRAPCVRIRSPHARHATRSPIPPTMSPDSTANPTMDVDFQKMGIYIDGRTKNELDELLAAKKLEITARDLYGFSCMHYLDDGPMNEAASFFGLSRDASVDTDAPPKILDFGAGFAGDARVMASEFPGCELTGRGAAAHPAAAERFTALVGASARCKHQCLDIFNEPVVNAPFDHLFSVLVILHIPERDRLWRSLAEHVKPGGTAYVEDYFAARSDGRGQGAARGSLSCSSLPSREEYEAHAAGRGLRGRALGDDERASGPRPSRASRQVSRGSQSQRQIHGEALTAELDLFYSTVQQLFARGNLGGGAHQGAQAGRVVSGDGRSGTGGVDGNRREKSSDKEACDDKRGGKRRGVHAWGAAAGGGGGDEPRMAGCRPPPSVLML